MFLSLGKPVGTNTHHPHTTQNHKAEWQAALHRGGGAKRQTFRAVSRRSLHQRWVGHSNPWFNESLGSRRPVDSASFGCGKNHSDRSQAVASSSDFVPDVSRELLCLLNFEFRSDFGSDATRHSTSTNTNMTQRKEKSTSCESYALR